MLTLPGNTAPSPIPMTLCPKGSEGETFLDTLQAQVPKIAPCPAGLLSVLPPPGMAASGAPNPGGLCAGEVLSHYLFSLRLNTTVQPHSRPLSHKESGNLGFEAILEEKKKERKEPSNF